MLNISLKGTWQDASNNTWVFYGDDEDANRFYVIPAPQYVMNGAVPSMQIVTYETDGSDSGSGWCRVDVELGVPQAVMQGIQAQVQKQFPGATSPVYQALDYNPGATAFLTFSSGGFGTPAHVTGELFKLQAGIRARHIPYQALPQAIGDLLNGTNQFQFITPLPVLELIAAGQLRALAVAAPARSARRRWSTSLPSTGSRSIPGRPTRTPPARRA